MRLGLLIFSILLFFKAAAADPIYRTVDEEGRMIFQSSPQGKSGESVNLPKIEKENFNKRIENLKKTIPDTCQKRGGIDCSKGADGDGSVICLDDFKESPLSFTEECSRVRLQITAENFFDKVDMPLKGNDLRPESYGGTVPTRISIQVRNLSSVKAEEVQVAAEIVKRPFPAIGPEVIEPFGLEEYTVFIDRKELPPFADFRTRYRTRLNCKNCISINRLRR